MENLLKHFKSNRCLAQDYGYSIMADQEKKKQRNEAQNQRRAEKRVHDSTGENLTTLVIQAPQSIHAALKFIAVQPVDVVLGVAEEIKKMTM